MARDQDILTVKELSDLLRLHPTTVYKLVRQGKIPSFRVGNEWRFRKDAIMRWLSEKSEGAGKVRKVIDTGGEGRVRGPAR
jgi:excisionase family DNA binding protein